MRNYMLATAHSVAVSLMCSIMFGRMAAVNGRIRWEGECRRSHWGILLQRSDEGKSALYLVWQQGREDAEAAYGARSFGKDLGQLFRASPDNTFLLKVSYWLDR